MKAAVLTLLNVLVPVSLAFSMYWVVVGRVPPSLLARLGLVLGAMLAFALTLTAVANTQRWRRRDRNERYCAERGYKFCDVASISDLAHDARLFHQDQVRIEQLSSGEYRNTRFDVFDLSYQITVQQNEGGSTSHVVSKTVALLPDREVEEVPICVEPFDGLAADMARFLGITNSVSTTKTHDRADSPLVRWFDQHYHITCDDESGQRGAEALLQPNVIQWLREHERLAFEIAAGRLFVWRPSQLVDSADRDCLVEEAIQLAELLHQHKAPTAPTISIEPPPVASVEGLMLRMVLSGLASWAIAAGVAMVVFFTSIGLGWVQQAPKLTIVVMMSLTMIVWVGSSLFIHRHISRSRRPPID